MTLTFAVAAIVKKNLKNWKRSGISFLATVASVFILIFIQETIIYPPNPKSDQLILSAYREAPLGGIWLGVYNDQTWQLGNSSVEITSEGTYQLTGDTLTLTANEGTTIMGEFQRTSFIIKPKHLIEIKNSGIWSLEIQLNTLEIDRP